MQDRQTLESLGTAPVRRGTDGNCGCSFSRQARNIWHDISIAENFCARERCEGLSRQRSSFSVAM